MREGGGQSKQAYINGKLETGRNISRGSFFEKFKTVAMVMKKPSKSKDIGPIIMIFAVSSQLIHT